jgi:hypothetical protein
MKEEFKEIANSWGTYLALIPFVVLLVYGVVVVSSSVEGAVSIGSWISKVFLTLVISAVVFIGLSVFIGRRGD